MLRKVVAMSFLLLLILAAQSWASQEDGNYSMPLVAPEYGAPPRTYHDSKVVTVTFKTTPEALKKLIPKPMVPNPDNLVSVYFGQFNAPDYTSGPYTFEGGPYLESGFVVPVTLSTKPGGYSLYLYLNKTAPAISGREIWGFPKKEADIVMTEENGKIGFTVTRLGTAIMKATFQKTAKVEPVPARPPRLRYNLKYIPSVKKNAPPDVMQITSYLQAAKLKELQQGKATLELDSTSVDPLGRLPILQIVRAEYTVIDGAVDYGEVVYDYLKEGAR